MQKEKEKKLVRTIRNNSFFMMFLSCTFVLLIIYSNSLQDDELDTGYFIFASGLIIYTAFNVYMIVKRLKMYTIPRTIREIHFKDEKIIFQSIEMNSFFLKIPSKSFCFNRTDAEKCKTFKADYFYRYSAFEDSTLNIFIDNKQFFLCMNFFSSNEVKNIIKEFRNLGVKIITSQERLLEYKKKNPKIS